jgi:hypothetical protein
LTHIAWQPYTIVLGYSVTHEIVAAGEQLAGFYVVANLGLCTAIASAAAATTRWRTRPLVLARK